MKVDNMLKEIVKDYNRINVILDSVNGDDILDAMSSRKLLMTELEKQYKALEKYMKGTFDLPIKYENNYGVWQLKKRDNYEITDNKKLVEYIGFEEFTNIAKASKAQFEKVSGKVGVKKALKEGWLILKSVTEYMSFKPHKK